MEVFILKHENARQLAHPLLACGAGLCWGMDALPELARGPHGKPFFPQYPQFQFNLSHSGSLALCALDSQPIGADIQVPKPHRPSLPDQVCSPGERAWLRSRGDSDEDFALLWSMKESCCKYSGLGLRRPISAIRVPLPEPGEDRLELDGLRFYLRAGEGWRLSLCGTGEWDGSIHWLDRLPEDLPPFPEF